MLEAISVNREKSLNYLSGKKHTNVFLGVAERCYHFRYSSRAVCQFAGCASVGAERGWKRCQWIVGVK
jgi:hypothetical protein